MARRRPIDIRIDGAHLLPRSVSSDRLVEAARTLAAKVGVQGTCISIRVRRGKLADDREPVYAVAFPGRTLHDIDLHDPSIRAWARGNRVSQRVAYARMLAHEMTHLQQATRGSVGLTAREAEDEAENNERAWGDIALLVLEGKA